MDAGGEVIVARASGPGGGGTRTIVRLSGGTLALRDVLSGLIEPLPQGAGATTTRLRVPGKTKHHWLPVCVVWYQSPHSFTGEESAEILLPASAGGGRAAGGAALVERVVGMLAAQPGVREARPGEFSARAYLNGKLTLAQAEGVAAAIAAGTEEELHAARAALAGERGKYYAAWAEETATLLALVEAGIDFADQDDVVPITPAALHARLGTLATAMERALGSDKGSERPDWLPRVVLEGPPNAGKSTLFNALLGRRRAITSPVAGTTRDAIAEPVLLAEGGLEVVLVDLPGVDDAGLSNGALDEAAQARAGQASAEADVRVRCRAANAADVERHDHHHAPDDSRLIRVVTKADLAGTTDESGAIRVCALDGRGLGALRREIVRRAWGTSARTAPNTNATSVGLLPRHRRALIRAIAHLCCAHAEIEPQARMLERPEVIAAALREGLDWLGELTGRMDPDAIIGRVFSTFCVGK